MATKREPIVHVEKNIATHSWQKIGTWVEAATGLRVPSPKTVTAGCGKRVKSHNISEVATEVSCQVCLKYAADEYKRHEHANKQALELISNLSLEQREILTRELNYSAAMVRAFEAQIDL